MGCDADTCITSRSVRAVRAVIEALEVAGSWGQAQRLRYHDLGILWHMPNAVVIRARRETRDLLHDLAKASGATAIDTLDRLVREAAEERLLEGLVNDLSSAPGLDATELRVWDASLMDGLDPDEDFSSWR